MTGKTKTNVLIIGGGPAGYTAAIYASRANLEPMLLEGMEPGGQLTTTTDVENFPGYPDGVNGTEMMMQIREQALRFGSDIREGVVTSVDLSKRPFIAEVNGGEYSVEAETVIIATGATAKYLGLADEDKYKGMGVSACATCDGFFYRNMDVAVVGGGDTACEEAIYLAGLAKKVYMIVRRNVLRASQVMQDRVMKHPKIEILWEHQTVGLFGKDVVEGAKLVKRKGQPDEEQVEIKIDGFFLAIGHKPNTDFLGGQVELDEQGYIKRVPETQKTSVEGVFAAGDVADTRYRQAITAAGSGCKAAMEVEQFLANQQ